MKKTKKNSVWRKVLTKVKSLWELIKIYCTAPAFAEEPLCICGLWRGGAGIRQLQVHENSDPGVTP